MNITIYGLVDPRNPQDIRYVGQTAFPRERHLQHLRRGTAKSSKSEWIEALAQSGVFPQMVLLETVDAIGANKAEKDWQAKYANLTNDRISEHNRTISKPIKVGPFQDAKNATERAWVTDALITCDWTISAAAELLGISRPTLYDKIARLGIVRPEMAPLV